MSLLTVKTLPAIRQHFEKHNPQFIVELDDVIDCVEQQEFHFVEQFGRLEPPRQGIDDVDVLAVAQPHRVALPAHPLADQRTQIRRGVGVADGVVGAPRMPGGLET